VALTEKNRSALYQGLSNIVNEEAVEEMLSYFPARDVEEPVTKEILHAEMADLRTELHTEIAQVRVEIADLRTELKSDIAELRTELKGDIAELRGEMTTLRSELRSEMTTLGSQLQGEMTTLEQRLIDRINSAQRWNIATMIALAVMLIAAIRI